MGCVLGGAEAPWAVERKAEAGPVLLRGFSIPLNLRILRENCIHLCGGFCIPLFSSSKQFNTAPWKAELTPSSSSAVADGSQMFVEVMVKTEV